MKELLFYWFALVVNFLAGVTIAGQFPAIIPFASAVSIILGTIFILVLSGAGAVLLGISIYKHFNKGE